MPVIAEEEDPCSTNMSKENVVVTSKATNGDSHSNGDDAIVQGVPGPIKDGDSSVANGDATPNVEGATPTGEGATPTAEGVTKETEGEDIVAITLKLIVPGVDEPIKIMHIVKDTVNDLLQYASEHAESCYRTCLAVYFKGKKLDNFIELGGVEGLEADSIVKLVEVPYSLRDVLLHVQRLQELVSCNSLHQSFSCTNGQSLCLLPKLVGPDLENNGGHSDPPKNFTGLEPPPCCVPSQPATPQSPEVPIVDTFYPLGMDLNPSSIQCLKSLCYSSWNPPLPNRKLKGDILYLDIVLLEGERLCITATPTGFFVNRTVPDKSFDPLPRKIPHTSQHLLTLLKQISPLFKKNYALVQKWGEKSHVMEVLSVPYPVYPWVAPRPNYKLQNFRLDENMGLKLPADELLVGQLRDWNEEFQTLRELPAENIQQRVFRDRAFFKVHSDFIQAAVRGGMAAVNGELHPLNPGDPERHHMYLWNNIFFSTGFDGRGHFKEFGGEEAGHTAANYDLQGVDILEKLSIPGIFTLGAVLVDYRGYRVFAQSIVPGLLQKEHDSSIMYGSMDNGKNFSQNEKFNELMEKCGKDLNLRPHKIVTESGDTITVPVSVEVKGIEGTDSRQYALDMFRVLPPDANYADPALVNGDVDPSSERPTANELGLRHKLYLVRMELVESYIGTVALQLHLTKMIGLEKKSKEGGASGSHDNTGEKGEGPTNENGVESEKESVDNKEQDNAIADAETTPTVVKGEGPDLTVNGLESTPLKEEGLDDTPLGEEEEDGRDILMELYGDMSIQFNVDIFTGGLKTADTVEERQLDRRRCIHLSQYLISIVIPKFVKDCLFLNIMPLDGSGLRSQMHARGINMRYLGRVAAIAACREDLHHLHRLCISEMILRVAKRKLRKVLVDTPISSTASTTAHFLNCLLSKHEDGVVGVADEVTAAHSKKKQKKKKNNKGSEVLTPSLLWLQIKEDVLFHFRHPLEYSSLNEAVEACHLQRVALMREICLKTGIQVYLREYDFTSPAPFTDDDIINLVPVVKHTHYRPVEATSMYDLAYSRLNSGNLKFAHELLSEAIHLSVQVYGPLHTDIARCYRLLARIHNLMGECQPAIQYQYKATLMYERLLGLDHCTTLSSYFSLAQYCLQGGRTAPALKLFYRVKYLTILSHGKDHPEIANVDFQIAMCLCNLKQYTLSLTFLYNALGLQQKYYGKDCVPVGVSHTLAAHALAELGEFREALRHEKIAFAVYKERLGVDHEKTKKSSECLQMLTERAVYVQKQIKSANDIRVVTSDQSTQQQSTKNQRNHGNSNAKRKNKPKDTASPVAAS